MSVKKDAVKKKEEILSLVSQAGSFLPDNQRELQELLTVDTLQQVLCEILTEADAQASILLAANLADPASVAGASKVQGIAYGMSRAVELILDKAYDKL